MLLSDDVCRMGVVIIILYTVVESEEPEYNTATPPSGIPVIICLKINLINFYLSS